jgi:hypothetical protein
MNAAVRIAAAALLAVACDAHAGSARLQGHWTGVAAEGVTGDALAAATAFAKATEMDVQGDRLTITSPKETQSGRYRVLKEDATTLVLATDRDGFEHPQTFVFTNRDETLRWSVLEGRAIVFARAH